jgi:hypothetical protein
LAPDVDIASQRKACVAKGPMKPSKLLAIYCCLLGLFITATAFAADDVVITAKAREHFKAGVAYVDDPSGPKYEEAYREFHLAYLESPTYRILTNIGLCSLNLERDQEALESYVKFLSQAKSTDIPKDKRTIMERDIATLTASLVRLTVTASPTTLILSDERLPSKGTPVTNRYDLTGGSLSLGIHPGHHRITASADGYESQTWDFEANSATSHEHTFTLKPIPTSTPEPAQKADIKPDTTVIAPAETKKKKTPTFIYVGAATTGVFAVGATVMGLVEHAKKTDYDNLNKAGTNPNKANDMHDRVKRYALYTDIGIGAAVLSAGATAILYFTSSSNKTETLGTASRLRLDSNVSPTHWHFLLGPVLKGAIYHAQDKRNHGWMRCHFAGSGLRAAEN